MVSLCYYFLSLQDPNRMILENVMVRVVWMRLIPLITLPKVFNGLIMIHNRTKPFEIFVFDGAQQLQRLIIVLF